MVINDNLIQTQRGNPHKLYANKTLIFGEKSPGYFDSYFASYFLSFYGHSYSKNIYIFVLLRNPIKQLWSHLWMRTHHCQVDGRKNKYVKDKTNIDSIHSMENFIQYFLKYHVQNQLPLFYQLMTLLNTKGFE